MKEERKKARSKIEGKIFEFEKSIERLKNKISPPLQNDLSMALIWEGFIKERGFTIRSVAKKLGVARDSVRYRLNNTLKPNGWISFRKPREKENLLWAIPGKRRKLLENWLSHHVWFINWVLHIPQFPMVARFVFEEIGKEGKSASHLAERLKECGLGEKYLQSESYEMVEKLGVERTLNGIIESVIRFFYPYIETEFRVKGGEGIIRFKRRKEHTPPLLISDDWRFWIPGKKDEVDAEREAYLSIDLSAPKYKLTSPGGPIRFPSKSEFRWEVFKLELEKMDEKVGNVSPKWAPFEFFEKGSRIKTDRNCQTCREKVKIEFPRFEVNLFEKNLGMETGEKKVAQVEKCGREAKRLAHYSSTDLGRDVFVLKRCPKGKAGFILSWEMYVPTCFS